MIITAVLRIILNLFNFFTLMIDIPSLPSEVNSYVTTLIEYVGTGLGIISNYTNLPYLLTLFGFVVAIEIALSGYKLIMFFVKKIPMLNIQ